MESLNKTIMILFVVIFLAGTVSAFGETADFDETDGEYGSYSIESGWGILPEFLGGGDLAWVKLTENSDHCLINCYAKGEGYFNEPKNFLDGIEFKNRLGEDETDLEDVKILIGQLEEVTKQNPIHEEVCEEAEGNITNKSYINCYNKLIGYEDYTEEEMVVREYEGWDIDGDFIWEIKAKKSPGVSIDWIITIWGERLEKWAWWDNDWELKRLINLTANVGNISYLGNISFDADMQADFDDIRFLDNATESVELNYTIERKIDSDYAVVRVFSQGETSFYMYYGNPLATYGGSASNTLLKPIIAYYFDDNANDFIGTNNGTPTGSPTLTTGYINRSYNFVRASSQWITSTSNIGITGTASRTVSFWAYNDDATNSGMVSWGVAGVGDMFSLLVNGGNYYFSGYGGGMDWATGQAVITGEWVHHIVTYESGHVEWYINNTRIGTGGDVGISTTDSVIYVGKRLDSADYFDGKMDELYIYDRVLNPTEREQIFTQTQPNYTVGEEVFFGPEITLTSPEDALQTAQTYQNFRCSASFDSDIANLTLILNGADAFTNSTVGTFIDLNYSQNITTEGIYNWSCRAETVSGIITQSENRTLTIHTTTPGIIIYDPNATLGYHLLGNNLTLNWTIVEAGENLTEHIKNCTYEYNGDLVVLNNTLCTEINQTSFEYALGVNNLTFNVTDIFDLVNSTQAEWIIKFLEISKTYETEVIEGIPTTITYKALIDGNIDSAVIDYNGTNYTTSINYDGVNYSISSTIVTPLVNTTQNITFKLFAEIDGTTYATAETNQTIQAINFTNCTSGNILLNISLYKEEEKTSLSGTIELNAGLVSKLSGETTDSFLLEVGSTSTLSLCLDPISAVENFYLDTDITYSSTDYAKEFYFIRNADISDYPINLSLFDLALNSSTEFLLRYQGQTLTKVEGAIIQLQRYYVSEGIYETVEAPLTSISGTAIAHIDLNTNRYKAVVVKDGVILDIFEDIVFDCENELSGQCTQNLYADVTPYNTIDSATLNDFSYAISDTGAKLVTTFSIPSGSTSPINIVMTQKDQFGNTTSCNKTVTTSSGSLECDYNQTIGDSYLFLEINKAGEMQAQKEYFVPEANGIDWGGLNWLFMFALIISLSLMAISSPEWIIGNGVITFIIGGSLWLVSGTNIVAGLGLLIWLLVSAIILILELAKQEDR